MTRISIHREKKTQLARRERKTLVNNNREKNRNQRLYNNPRQMGAHCIMHHRFLLCYMPCNELCDEFLINTRSDFLFHSHYFEKYSRVLCMCQFSEIQREFAPLHQRYWNLRERQGYWINISIICGQVSKLLTRVDIRVLHTQF